MIVSKRMPTKGQFIAIWSYNGEVWSRTCKVVKGGISVYDEEDDSWYYGRAIPKYSECVLVGYVYLP